jgi:predicted PurR-regulated permease PerM
MESKGTFHNVSKFIFFGGIFFIFFLFINRISTVLTPFVISFIIAYLFAPLALRIQENTRLGKSFSSAVIVIIIQLILIITLAIAVPFIYGQILSLFKMWPEILNFWEKTLLPSLPGFLREMYGEASSKIDAKVIFSKTIEERQMLLMHAYNSGITVIHIISTMVLVPILTFYMLRDWTKMRCASLNLIPVLYKEEFREVVNEIRKRVSGYIQGQVYVIIILSALYGAGLAICGLPFGFLIGFLAGLLSIIPYVGFTICFITALLIAFATHMSYSAIICVCSVFLIVQVLESNVIVPKLVGGKVGLHPLWIIFGLLSGGSLLGFIGLLLAIPITTIISVLIRHYIRKYKNSGYYGD